MNWDQAFAGDRQPTPAQIERYVDNPLWVEFNQYMQEQYKTAPKTAYSGCSMQPGWNLKYQKGGRSLCTLYPAQGYFIALVVIGAKEELEAEALLPLLTQTTQALYRGTDGASSMGRWLMIEVKSAQQLRDVKALVAVRRKP